MLEFLYLSNITWHTDQWFLFQFYVIFVWIAMLPRMVLAGVFYQLKNRKLIQNYPLTKKDATVVLTIYKEDPIILEQCIAKVRRALEIGCKKFAIIAIIDGWQNDDFDSEQYKITQRYADVVLGTDARNKRKNLRALLKEARKRGVLYDITIFLDSDTIPKDDQVVLNLLAPFSDPMIGGATTAQLVHNPKTLSERISFWLEDARLNSSMAAASLFGQVACLPGRMYAVKTSLVEHRMDELVNDSFSYFGFMRRSCIAGDDRVITNFILEAGYKTVLVPEAVITTLAPATFKQTFKMWVRWGRTSQGYTLRSPWLHHYPFAFFVYWTDILVSLFTVGIVALYWPYQMLWGETHRPIMQALTVALLGMMLTMAIRQYPHLHKYKRDWSVLPAFVLVVTYAQFIRVWALMTQHKVGIWGSRQGADTGKKDDFVRILSVKSAIEPIKPILITTMTSPAPVNNPPATVQNQASHQLEETEL